MATFNIKSAPYLATGNGTTNDLPAFLGALAAARPGDTVLVPPGNYRMILGGGAFTIPQGVTISGTPGSSVFLLSTNAAPENYREFWTPTSNVTIQGIDIRSDRISGVLMPMRATASNVTIRNCDWDGGEWFHGFRVGMATTTNFTIIGTRITNFGFGLFASNDATGVLDGMLVQDCRFENNGATDLEFNHPSQAARNIVVKNSSFKNNRGGASGGFAVGFANVQNSRVEDCYIEDYKAESLHVEDRSADIALVNNVVVYGSNVQPYGVVFIVNNSRRVTVSGNVFDSRLNSNTSAAVYAGSGGPYPNSSGIIVSNNDILRGAQTNTYYLQDGNGTVTNDRVYSFGSAIPAALETRIQAARDGTP